ncbi:MAG: hypothetical protein JO352_09965 [Chloroflexi bacterium]|nr:hypothetical protein [Chloroflexota bacterium]MBV9601369.1 hypothetical protein [Chloroflexota bacterium]
MDAIDAEWVEPAIEKLVDTIVSAAITNEIGNGLQRAFSGLNIALEPRDDAARERRRARFRCRRARVYRSADAAAATAGASLVAIAAQVGVQAGWLQRSLSDAERAGGLSIGAP